MLDISIDVSAIMTVIVFLIGSGLLVLGAFFLWRVIRLQGGVGTLVALILPSVAMALCLIIKGEVELIVCVASGIVVVNLGLLGIFVLCRRGVGERKTVLLTGLWLLFGLVACLMAGHRGGMGRFGGLGLLLAGLVVVLQFNEQNQLLRQSCRLAKLWWVVLIVMALMMLGAWLMVEQIQTVSSLMGLPSGILGQIVVAPLISVSVLAGLCQKDKRQAEQVFTGLMWSNAILVMVVFGVLALYTGGLHLGQSLLQVTLPCAIVMTMIVTLSGYLPTKTVR